jgi:hypothetical protein
MTSVHINRPTTFYRRRIEYCPFEQRRQEMVVGFAEWYDPTVFCCGCGDCWTAGERHERPLSRYWRRDAVRTIRQLWDVATYGPSPTLADFDPSFREVELP